MNRRELLINASALFLLPLSARAEQKTPLIAVLSSRSAKDSATLMDALRNGLRSGGSIEGTTATIEYRYANGNYARLPALARELLELSPSVIVTTGSEPSALAAKQATSTMPIVFVIGGDPVRFGLVSSLNRPTGNVTGVSASSSILVSKRLELLHQLLPWAHVVVFLRNPRGPNAADDTAEAREGARKLGLELTVLDASTEHELELAFAAAKNANAAGLSINLDPFFGTVRTRIYALAEQYRMPTIYFFGYYAREGGLIAYGPDLADSYRQAGVYAAKVVHGTKIGDLPVLEPVKFELLLNLKTAKKLGLSVPPTLLAIADQVVE